MTATLLGCGGKAAQKTPERIENPRVVAQLDALYEEYVDGDLRSAESSMQRAIELLGHSDKMFQREQGLGLAYARLYCVQSKAGKTNEACLSYVKAKYWYCVALEASGTKADEIASKMTEFTEEKCKAAVMKFDQERTNGRGPKYLLSESRLSLPSSTNGPSSPSGSKLDH